MTFHHGVKAVDYRRDVIYYPAKRPGFVAWTTAFDYGNGHIGLSFNEVIQEQNTNYQPPKLEMGEAVGAPVSYCSVECGSPNEMAYRVYMVSKDNGKTFEETGRCPLSIGSFCNIGFPDGRIIGYDVPRINKEGTGWDERIVVSESTDGGNTWTKLTTLLEGTAPYLWRVRRLRDGTIVLLASLYGTPWGGNHQRTTRNTMLPGESYLAKIQTFFMTSNNGVDFSVPHYVLPGIGAHEYDMVECSNGDLLFIAGDVQATPVARQRVERRPQAKGEDLFLNGTLYPIHRGAPTAPKADPQGGFVPESVVLLKDGLLVGSRRNKPYSCSNDFGENWFEIDGLPTSLYQPFLELLPNGMIANFGHFGGDAAFGQADMYVGADFFFIDNQLPAACTLSLSRLLADDNSTYENQFSAALTVQGVPVIGEDVLFRFTPIWNIDGTVNHTPQDNAPLQLTATTDSCGVARVDVRPYFDNIPDIHHYYNVDVVYRPEPPRKYQPCLGPMMCVASLTPHRENRYPYPAYLAEGTLFLSPDALEQHPTLVQELTPKIEKDLPKNFVDKLSTSVFQFLVDAHIIIMDGEDYVWYSSVHRSYPIDKILPMSEGDWYV